jgi:hypothetical protein
VCFLYCYLPVSIFYLFPVFIYFLFLFISCFYLFPGLGGFAVFSILAVDVLAAGGFSASLGAFTLALGIVFDDAELALLGEESVLLEAVFLLGAQRGGLGDDFSPFVHFDVFFG